MRIPNLPRMVRPRCPLPFGGVVVGLFALIGSTFLCSSELTPQTILVGMRLNS